MKEHESQYTLKCLGLLEAIRMRKNVKSEADWIKTADKFLFRILRFTDFRDFEGIKELVLLRTSFAIELSDTDFFVRLGRALEKPGMAFHTRVADDKLSLFLIYGWFNPIGKDDTGEDFYLSDLTDQAITDFANGYFHRGINPFTMDSVRKARQRLSLNRNSQPRFKHFASDSHGNVTLS